MRNRLSLLLLLLPFLSGCYFSRDLRSRLIEDEFKREDNPDTLPVFGYTGTTVRRTCPLLQRPFAVRIDGAKDTAVLMLDVPYWRFGSLRSEIHPLRSLKDSTQALLRTTSDSIELIVSPYAYGLTARETLAGEPANLLLLLGSNVPERDSLVVLDTALRLVYSEHGLRKDRRVWTRRPEPTKADVCVRKTGAALADIVTSPIQGSLFVLAVITFPFAWLLAGAIPSFSGYH